MQVKILGTQSPYNTPKHNCPGFLITEGDTKVMFDCGSGSTRLLKFPDDLENLHLFVSHFHRDHYNDIYNLQYASYVFHNQGRLAHPIEVHLPMVASCYLEDIITEEKAHMHYNPIINEYDGIEVGKLKITFCLTGHTTESYAFKICNGKQTVVYTSDIPFSSKEDIVTFCKDTDLLICESSLLESDGFPEINSHITAKQAAIIAKEANVKKLVLTHFWPEKSPMLYVTEAKRVYANVVAAEEGQIIDVAEI